MALSGKIAIVTGGSRGLGRGIALQLGEAGATVYVTGRQPHLSLQADQGNLPTLEKTADEITERGGKGIAVYVDHSDMAEVEKFFKRIDEETNGQLDILVNNAFSAIPQITKINGRKFWEMEPELWDQVNNVGLRNHYYCSVYAARMMTKRRSGFIVNVSSPGGLKYFYTVAYGVGKEAKDRMAADMALELKDYGVTMISLWPGVVLENFAESGGVVHEGSQNLPPRLKQLMTETESTEFAGKAVVALAKDPKLFKKTGRILTTADLGIDYGFRDIDGKQPNSLRGMKILLALFGFGSIGDYFPTWFRAPGWLVTASMSRL